MSWILSLLTLTSSLAFSEPHFKDVSIGSGLEGSSSTTISFGDFNNDGLPDLLASGQLFMNTTRGNIITFENVTEEMGLSGFTGHPMFADINNDQKTDILTSSGQIFLQQTGQFHDATKQLGLVESTEYMTVSVGDFNRDGWPDIFYGASEKHTDTEFFHFPPKLFMNEKGTKFVNVSESWQLANFPGYTRGITWVDYNNDAQVDVYLSNYRLLPNFFFENSGGKFKERSAELGIRGEYDPNRYYDSVMLKKYGPNWGHTIGSTWADYDNDGFLDLWVSNLVHKFVGHSNGYYDIRGYVCDDSKIYRNIKGQKFVDMRSQTGISLKPRGGSGVYVGDELWSHSTSADIDNDGYLDTYVAQIYDLPYAHSLLFKNLGGFKFKEIGGQENVRVFDSYGGAFADLDNDGRQDLVVAGRAKNGAQPNIRVFKNITENKSNFVKFKLVGKSSSTFPVGAQVRIKLSGQTLVRQFEGNTGTLNQQNDPVIHFGLGMNHQIEEIEVVWPSGLRQQIQPTKIELNKTHIIHEP